MEEGDHAFVITFLRGSIRDFTPEQLLRGNYIKLMVEAEHQLALRDLWLLCTTEAAVYTHRTKREGQKC